MIRSYYRDLRWLELCLQSIRRHCSGFRRTIVVVPASSRARLDHAGLAGDVTLTCPDVPDDYLGQQVTKLTADLLTDAGLICHVDSDCIFRRATTPRDLLVDGRPYVLLEPYDRLDPHVPWKLLTERFLGGRVEHEFMRSPPYTFPRWTYRALRAHALETLGTPLEEYVLAQPHRGFSEFNALGAYAYRFHRSEFTWIDPLVDRAPEPPCRVFWSRTGPTAEQLREIAELLGSSVPPVGGQPVSRR